ncbi:MAG: hypothetical protein KA778_03365 [Burkholderiaceae bacterium]|nr:hypothetical protein [Burkholderiaceae bacterium]MBP7659012.1 hypothetical protein [Burkholderiaceae bacterium]
MSRILFALLMLLNVAALGLWFVLGLAAAKPSHTPVVSVVGFFMLPALLLGGVVLLYLRGPWAWSRALAIGLAALPVLILAAGVLLARGVAWHAGVSADDWGRPDPVAQQGLEAAIAARDAVAVGRIAADRSGRLNDAAALVAAIRLLERDPTGLDPLRALLQAGLKPGASSTGEAPLESAIRVSRIAGTEPVRLLLQAGADPNLRSATQPAWFAALELRTHAEVLPLLLERGANLRAVDMAGSGAVHWASYHQNWTATALLIERGADWQAVQAQNGQGLRQLVEMQLRRTPSDPALARLAGLLRPAR